MKRAFAAVISSGLLFGTAANARAADCWGATARRVTVRENIALFVGTVTYPGASHDNLIQAPGGFSFKIVDAENEANVLVDLQIPAENFDSSERVTRYDRAGTADALIRLRNLRHQADTIRVSVRLRGEFDLSSTPGGVRVLVEGGGTCARSCVSACRPENADIKLRCDQSSLYQPFADEGFGQLFSPHYRSRVARSGYCGLSIPSAGPRCDFLIDEHCLLPYPSSVFLEEDPSTPTGLRIHYDGGALPTNAFGKTIDPTDWNTLDGFSPGPVVVTLFPDNGVPVDPARSGAAFHTDFARSLDADHPTILMRASDGERVLHFAEMDTQTEVFEKRALMLRPGKRLEDATRYLVAFRDLVDTQGDPIRPRLAFRALRDQATHEELVAACGQGCATALAARGASLEDVFEKLEQAGVARDDLLLAWDFTTASTEALTGWMVAVRDQAFALGTPTFSVDSIDDGGGAGRNELIYARVEGTFQAPLFMTEDAPGSRLHLVGGVPTQNGFATVPYVVDIPHVAVASRNPGAVPARATLWGHGLLGTRFQLGTLSELAENFNFVIAAVDMQGMSDPDLVPAIVTLITDFSFFHRIPERLHQGFLNHLLLGRLLNDPVNGFNSHPAFQLGQNDAPIVDTSQVYYSGGSQGGIFGVAIMGITQEFERGFVAVPGSNYSTLLQRSIDFEPFLSLLNTAYRDPLEATLIYPLIQQLWDRAEPQGYLPHVTAGTLSDPPFPHKVLLHMSRYDSEVSNLATEIMVRSLGVPQIAPAINSFVDIEEVAAPLDGSALVEIDTRLGFDRCHTPGTDDRGAACTTDSDCPGAGDPDTRTVCASGIPPLTNDAPVFNNGAHGATGTPAAGEQIDAFLRTGGVIDQFCDGICDPE